MMIASSPGIINTYFYIQAEESPPSFEVCSLLKRKANTAKTSLTIIIFVSSFCVKKQTWTLQTNMAIPPYTTHASGDTTTLQKTSYTTVHLSQLQTSTATRHWIKPKETWRKPCTTLPWKPARTSRRSSSKIRVGWGWRQDLATQLCPGTRG